MRRVVVKTLVGVVSAVVVLVAVVVATTAVWYLRADFMRPEVTVDTLEWPVVVRDGYTECRGSMLRHAGSGLWEAWVEGDALERGVALGRLTAPLLYSQEKVFIDKIHSFVPDDRYLGLLRYLLVGFNRNLAENVAEEFRREIYGVAQSCSHQFDGIGGGYERQLNFHAAHDIGHMMQEYMLVGCSSLAAWGSAAKGGELVVGRNFDFWLDDHFARNRIVAFYAPEGGYRFASVTWPGMTGVLSGMNCEGLTVTINAAKGPLPTASATPISILAREILQYARTTEEAVAIARTRRTFVSESLLVGSALDGRAVVIEKTPRRTEVFDPGAGESSVVCTNHFQSEAFAGDRRNMANIAESDSPYRWRRIRELLDEASAAGGIDERGVAAILRDRLGPGGVDIGVANPGSVNQSIAHHSVIFLPERRLMWVSTAPWQSGEWVCYDLGRIFGAPGSAPDFSGELCDAARAIPADSAFLAHDLARVERHRSLPAQPSQKDLLLHAANNPSSHHVWVALGEYYLEKGEKWRAAENFRIALSKEIPAAGERREIEKKLRKL